MNRRRERAGLGLEVEASADILCARDEERHGDTSAQRSAQGALDDLTSWAWSVDLEQGRACSPWGAP